MKLAVCFSGHMRSFERTHASFSRHISSLYDTNVFIHTWNNYSAGRGDVATNTQVSSKKIEDLYRPTRMIVEPQKQLHLTDHPTLHTTPNPPFNVLSKWFSASQSFELCKQFMNETGTTFDVIMSCRSDMEFHEDVTLPSVIVPGAVYTPGGNGGPPGTLHDYFAFGDRSAMTTYFGVYDNFDKIVSELNVSRFRAEEVITHHLLTTRTPLMYCYIEYSLSRLSGEVRRMKA